LENEYNILEEKLLECELSEIEKIRILERQKELLLLFLVDANKNIFNLFKIENPRFAEVKESERNTSININFD
jgi:hypothetical protein